VPQNGWTQKRERQYEHIKEGLLAQGRSEKKAEEIAARTVNKERARAGETKRPSGGPTKAELYDEAKRRGVAGRSTMDKAQLARAVGRS